MKNKKYKFSLLIFMLTASLSLQACGTKEKPTESDQTIEAPITSESIAVTEAPTEKPTITAAPEATQEPQVSETPQPTVIPDISGGIPLDLSERISVWGQDIGIGNTDGSVTYSGGTIDKCSIPLPNSIKANDTITLTAKIKFDSDDDIGVRFYLTDDALNNCTAEIITVSNSGTEATETTITLQAVQDANAIMFASSSYDVKLQNVTLYSITVSGDNIQSSVTPTLPSDSGDWLSVWATTEEKCNLSGDTDGAMPKMALEGTTIRQIIRVTAGGPYIRFRLSNQYGDEDVEINSMHVAKQSPDALSDKKGFGTAKVDMSTIVPSTDVEVCVDGQTSFVIPKGEVIITDPIALSVNGLDNIAVSMYFGKAPTTNITGHRGARATTYQVKGNQVSAEVLSGYQSTTSWFFLADCSATCPDGKSIVVFGDSITDGYGTDASYLGKKPDSYTRYIDYLAKRLQANESTKNVSILNEGLGANSILGAYPTVSGRQRFSRDVLEHDNVGYVIILFGVNDLDKLKDTSKYDLLIPEYEKMISLCHDNGIKVYGAPILPFGTSNYYSENSEKVRTMINDWMRSEDSNLDGIIDFDKALEDPENPTNILFQYTKSDGLHPYEGYEAMANCVDLNMFTE